MSADWTAQGRVVAGGKSLDYACWGPPPGEAPTLVLMHEGLGCVALWRDVPGKLVEATGWGVLAYSRAGYGQSDPADLPRPLDYMTREAGVMAEVIAAFELSCFVLLGHSDGATISTEYAGRFNDPALRGLIVMAPHVYAEPRGLAEIARARAAFETGDLRARMARYHRDPDTAFRGWCDAWLDPGFARWNVAHVIDSLAVPALVIQGREDPYGTLAQVDAFAARSPSAVTPLVLEHCRHAPHLEQPGRVLEAIVQFCASVGDVP